MRSITHILTLFCVTIAALGTASAQVTERGNIALTEGRQYMVAFTQVWTAPSEKPMPKPMVLFITSKSDTKVKITTPADINQNARINADYSVKKNQVLTVPIDLPYMNEESQTKAGNGIHVTADKPISVSTYQAWQGNGEVTRHLPVESWGQRYYSMNFYQDRYGTQQRGYEYRPSQILVIAAYENTVVSITPTYATEGGKDLKSLAARSTDSVVLKKGETFLIKSKIDESYTKNFISDLSGTLITSSRPIGVVSGHTKVAIMRYPDVLPPTGMFAADAHFVRNSVHDVMFPIEFAGTEFVTVPCMYTPTRVVGQSSVEFGIDDDRGDVIRFVATEDNTVVSRVRYDGSGSTTVAQLNAGESWLETSVELASKWTSNKPMFVGHYGKSYAKLLPPTKDIKRSENGVQGHPTVESGMPMLMTVPPSNRWISRGVFKSPEGMDNFFNIVFKPEDVERIKVDGRSISSAFGVSMRMLQGTPYAYVRTNVGAGDHVVESDVDSIKWMAWTYGSLDGLQQGRAYGAPLGIDLKVPCPDSLAIDETVSCGDVEVSARVLPEDLECAAIYNVYAESLSNYSLVIDTSFTSGDKTASYRLNVVNKTRDAEGTVLTMTRSGKFVRKTYAYIADKVSWKPSIVDFGKISFNDTTCRTIRIFNDRTDAPLTVNDVTAKNFPAIFSATPTSFVIPAGTSMELEVCAVITDANERFDTVLLQLDCFQQASVQLVVRAEEPVIYANDIDWIGVPWDSPGVVKIGEVLNSSGVEMVLTGYNPALLQGNFVPVTGFDLPVYISPRGKHTYQVLYQPSRVPGAPHKVEFVWRSNAKGVDSISIWNGDFISGVDDTEVPSISLYPSPLNLTEDGALTVTGVATSSVVTVVDALGGVVAIWRAEGDELRIPTNAFPAAGVYTVIVASGSSVEGRQVICIK
jgi:hypothetical protein